MTLRSIPGGASAHAAPRAGQASPSKPVDLRVVSGGRRRRDPLISRPEAKAKWADMITRRCDDREEAADLFRVTFQTACNWFDGFVVPSGDKVMMAMEFWPEEFGLVAEARAA